MFQIAALGAGALSNVFIARTLGPAGKGYLALAGYAVFVATSLGGLGTQPAAIHLLGKKRFDLPSVAGAVTLLSVAAALASAALTWVFLPRFQGGVPLTPSMVGLTALLVIPLLLRLNLGGLLLALGRIRLYNRIQAYPNVLWAVASFVVLILLGRGIDDAFRVWFAVYAASGLLASAVTLGIARPRLAGVVPVLRAALVFGLPAYLANLVWILALRVDSFILAAYRTAEDVGVYSIAVLIAEVVLYLPRSLALVMQRRVSASGPEEATRLAASACRNGAALSLLFAPLLAVGGMVAIPIVFGPRFSGAIGILLALLPGLVAMALGTPLVLYLVQQKGKPVLSGAAALIGLATDVALCLWWIPGHGAMGAAWASSVAYSAQAVFLLLLFRSGTGTPWRLILVVQRSDWIAARSLVARSLESLVPRTP